MRTVKVIRMKVAGRPILVKFKRGMRNLADHWMAGKRNRNPRIPRGEVWVNARLLKDREKLRRVLAHEKAELELMMRKGYSYRRAHRVANKREASLARRVELALLLLLLLPLVAVSASPGLTVYSASQPSWYDGSLLAGQRRVWYAANQVAFGCTNFDFENTYGPFSLANSSAIGGPNGLLGETGYSTGTRTTTVSFDTSQKYSGNYSLKLYAYANGGYALTNITLTATALQNATVYLRAMASASYGSTTAIYHSVWVRVRINGVTVLEWKYPKQASWTGASWTATSTATVPAGSTVRIELLAYAWAVDSTTLTAWFDAFVSNATIISAWQTAPAPAFSGGSTVQSGTLPGSWVQQVVPSCYASLSCTSSISGTSYTITIPSVVESSSTAPSAPSGASIAQQVYRYAKPVFSTTAGTLWLDEVVVSGGSYPSVTFAALVPKWTIPNAAITFYDAAMNSLGSTVQSAGTYYFALDAVPTYVRLNSTVYYAPACGYGTSFAFASNPSQITFTVQDYGQNFLALKVYDLQGRLIHARPLDSLGNAVLNLTAYTSYQLALWKPGAERAFGTLTISQSNYVITVLPTASTSIPARAIQAWYNQTDSNFYVIMNCSNPPCTVLLRKYYPNGTNVILAKWTCTQNYCRYTLLSSDPLVTAEAVDATGAKMMSFAGTSLYGLLNATQQSALQQLLTKVAGTWPQSWGGQAGLLALGGVLIFLALTVPGHLLIGAIALSAYVTLIGIIFNVWLVAGGGLTIIIVLIAIRYIVEQA
jgi:hypothetical protein